LFNNGFFSPEQKKHFDQQFICENDIYTTLKIKNWLTDKSIYDGNNPLTATNQTWVSGVTIFNYSVLNQLRIST